MKIFISAALLILALPRGVLGQECGAASACLTCIRDPQCTWIPETGQCMSSCPAWPDIVCITDATSCTPGTEEETGAPTGTAATGAPTAATTSSPTDMDDISAADPTSGPTDVTDPPTDAPEDPPLVVPDSTDAPTTTAPTAGLRTISPTTAPTTKSSTASPSAKATTNSPSTAPTFFDGRSCPPGHVQQADTLEDGEICLFCIPEGPVECAVGCLGPGQCQCANDIEECCTTNPCCDGCEDYEGHDAPQCSDISCSFVPEGCGKTVCFLTLPPSVSPTTMAPSDSPSYLPSVAPSDLPSASPTGYPTFAPTLQNACPANTTQEERIEREDESDVCLFCIPVGNFDCSVGCLYGPICQCAPPGATEDEIEECCAANPCCGGCPDSDSEECQFQAEKDCSFVPENCGEVMCFDKDLERNPPVSTELPTLKPSDPPTPESIDPGDPTSATTARQFGFLIVSLAWAMPLFAFA